MSIEYYLVDEQHKEAFELGKGNWSKMPLTNSEDMLKYITEHVKPGFEIDTPFEYFEWVVKKVMEFMKNRNVVIMCDNEFWGKFHTNPEYHVDGDNTTWCLVIDDRYEDQ